MKMTTLALKLSPPSISITPQHHSKPYPKPNNPDPLKARLINTLNAGDLRHAVSTVDLMSRRGSHPDLPTFSRLLKSCIRSRSFGLGELVHAQMVDSRLDLDSLALNSLLSLYSKNGKWETAVEIFDAMGEKRNLVSWTSMVSCYANNGFESEAVRAFVDMVERGFSPNEYCFSAVIRACSNVADSRLGNAVFGFSIKTGCFDSDVCVGCALIDMFAEGFDDLDNAYKVFDKMPERNTVTWTLMITRLVQLGCSEEAVELFLDMVSNDDFVPDRFTFSGALSACAESGLLPLGKQLHSQVLRSGFVSDRCIGSCLVDMYAKCGSVDESRKVFDQMPDRNVLSWTALINGYVHIGGRDHEAVELFRDMIVSGQVRPNHFTLSSVLKASSNLSDPTTGEQVHSLALKLGTASLDYIGNSLVHMYSRFDRIEDSRRAFDALSEKNAVSYAAIIDSYVKAFDFRRAFDLLGSGASEFSLSTLLTGAATVGSIAMGEQLHSRALKSGFDSHRSVVNALITMYSKCGDIDAGFRIFGASRDRDVVTWTAMISGFSKHGLGERALELFDEMLESGSTPNEITFTALLSGCSHSGLISEGLERFNEMYPKFGIVPRIEHYACVVDLLGRSGRLWEALRFINSMPFAADSLIWRTFLGSCRSRGDVELAEHAARVILERDPRDPAAYVQLASLYASAGRREDSGRIRKEMREKLVAKEAGSSWLEVGNLVNKFHAGDTWHPRSGEIYNELERLVAEIKELGYVPNTGLVVHDVEGEGERERERCLSQHSEKIAVAFGLISTSPESKKPIRVFKNLRVCGDCHNAIKYITLATGREIVLRDSNRFHHFKSGNCSCNDYW